jgi:hypothetical protein
MFMSGPVKWVGPVVVGLVVSVSACSSNSTNKATGGVSKDAGSGSDAAPSGLKLSWGVQDTLAAVPDGGTRPGLPGVKVCVDGHPEFACQTTDSDGHFVFKGLPATTQFVLTLVKDGYSSSLKPIITASTDMDDTTTPIFMLGAGLKLPDGTAVDSSKGNMFFFQIGPVPGDTTSGAFQTVAGVASTLTPESGSGPDFVGGNGKVLSTTTSVLNSYGFYYNLTPGDYTLTLTRPGTDCEAILTPFGGWGYPGGGAHQVAFPVRAGFVTTEVGLFCLPASDAGPSVPVDAGP